MADQDGMSVVKENLGGRRQDFLGALGVLAVKVVAGREWVLHRYHARADGRRRQ